MPPLVLQVFLGHERIALVRARVPIAPRHWLLGVAAIQVNVREQKPEAQLRIHSTGQGTPELRSLTTSVVHVALAEETANISPPAISPPALSLDGAAALSVSLDGEEIETVHLAQDRLDHAPLPRAFGHVFCRWLRDGEIEPGFDLTDFLSLPEGVKYERRILRTLNAGQVVSYGYAEKP